MIAEVVDSLTLRRFRELVDIRIGSIESSMEKNEIVSVFTSLALEEFDFILGSVGHQLSDAERQEFVFLLFDTIAEVADAATSENIDLRMIQTHNSITLPIRTQEVDIISRWFAQRAHSVEEYFLSITHAYHIYAATYYSIILLPHFKQALCVPISPKELYLTTVSDNIRPIILNYYYQKVVSDPQNTEIIRSFFISYGQLIFVKLLYVICLHAKNEDANESQSYFNYVRALGDKLMHKYNAT
jgi:hypothetical protein